MNDFDGVVFLPGLMCDERLFAPQLEALENFCFTEVADLSQHSRFEDMARSVLSKTKCKRFALVGLSMGGALAMNMARWFPEQVVRLAILDANPYEDDDARRIDRRRQIGRAQRDGLDVLMREELAPKYLALQNQNPETIQVLVDMAERYGVEVYKRQQAALMARQSVMDLLPNYTKPTLVLCGEEDVMCLPQWHKDIEEVMPNAELNLVSNAGHIITLENPDDVNRALLSWLQQ